jgi:hypothetical protein
MKAPSAWFACSLLSATCALASCGSDDGKHVVAAGEAGEGGEGGEASSNGGSSMTPSEGGAAGQPELPAAGMAGVPNAGGVGGMSGLGGAGGEAGEPTAPLCFDLSLAGAGGAAADAIGGAAGASPAPITFTCADVTGHYDTVAKKIVLDLPTGLEPATTGHFSTRYYYFEDPSFIEACAEGTVVNTGTTLELDVDFPQPIDPSNWIRIPFVAAEDACGGTVAMDNSSEVEGFCHGIRFAPPDVAGDDWTIGCYEGYGSECAETCPIAEAR